MPKSQLLLQNFQKRNRIELHGVFKQISAIDIVDVHHDGFAAWGEPCELRTASGNFSRASVDWDGSRHYDHSSNRTLNPGALKWQNRQVKQITSLADEYGFDGAFLDIAAVWANNPNHNVYEGVCELVRKLKEDRPDFLIAGEVGTTA